MNESICVTNEIGNKIGESWTFTFHVCLRPRCLFTHCDSGWHRFERPCFEKTPVFEPSASSLTPLIGEDDFELVYEADPLSEAFNYSALRRRVVASELVCTGSALRLEKGVTQTTEIVTDFLPCQSGTFSWVNWAAFFFECIFTAKAPAGCLPVLVGPRSLCVGTCGEIILRVG